MIKKKKKIGRPNTYLKLRYVQIIYNHVLQQNIPAIFKHFNVLLQKRLTKRIYL
jgi:hypothetical protein